MKKIFKKKDLKNLTDSITDHVMSRDSIVYKNDTIHRFFVPTYEVFESINPYYGYIDTNLRVSYAMVDIVDKPTMTICSYITDDGRYLCMAGYTFRSIIEATKSAKDSREPYVVDLANGKVIETNG